MLGPRNLRTRRSREPQNEPGFGLALQGGPGQHGVKGSVRRLPQKQRWRLNAAIMKEDHPPIDSGQLDEYSRFAVGLILSRFPVWRSHVAFRRPDGYASPFADFELQSPSPAIARGLWVSTADEEVTVGLHTHHSHFTDYDNRFDPQHIIDALDYVQDIFDDRCVIVSWYIGDRLICTTSKDVTTQHPATPPRGGVTRKTVRSWRGTCDSDVESGFRLWLGRILGK